MNKGQHRRTYGQFYLVMYALGCLLGMLMAHNNNWQFSVVAILISIFLFREWRKTNDRAIEKVTHQLTDLSIDSQTSYHVTGNHLLFNAKNIAERVEGTDSEYSVALSRLHKHNTITLFYLENFKAESIVKEISFIERHPYSVAFRLEEYNEPASLENVYFIFSESSAEEIFKAHQAGVYSRYSKVRENR